MNRLLPAVLLVVIAVALWLSLRQSPTPPTAAKDPATPAPSAEVTPGAPPPDAVTPAPGVAAREPAAATTPPVVAPAAVPGVAPRAPVTAVPPATSVPAMPPVATTTPPAEPATPDVPQPDLPAGTLQADLDAVSLMIRDFRATLKENPVGNNAEVTKALLGDNLKQVKVPLAAGSSVNGEGELCDRWGTPYFFHALSKTSMEVRSAGPDRTMWTSDDRQVK